MKVKEVVKVRNMSCEDKELKDWVEIIFWMIERRRQLTKMEEYKRGDPANYSC